MITVGIVGMGVIGTHIAEAIVKIYGAPGQQRNLHRVTIEGEFGRLTVEIENVPSENP